MDAPPQRSSAPVVLITGADGQVGWEACRAFAALGRVVPLRRSDVDLADPEALRRTVRTLRPALIVNAAAYTAVDRAEGDAATAFAVNADAPRVLADEAAQLGALLVHYSTDYVFDGSASDPYTEDAPTAPLGVYGESKLAGDRAIATSGASHLIFRTSWVYAARGQNFLRTMLRLAHDREVMRVVADQRGAPTPARLIATVSAQVLARHATATGFALAESQWGIYNLVTRGVTTWHEFARGILERDPRRDAQRCRELVPITTADYPTPARRPAFSVLDPTKLERTFGLHMPDWSTQLDLVMQELR